MIRKRKIIKKKEKTKKKTEKQSKIDSIFKPNKVGVSDWVSISKLIESKLWSEKSNGNQRNGIFLEDARYNWESERLNNKPKGKILKLRTIGLNNNILKVTNVRLEKILKNIVKIAPVYFVEHLVI